MTKVRATAAGQGRRGLRGAAHIAAVGQRDRRIVLALMSIVFIVAEVLAAFTPNIGVLLLARFELGLGIGGLWAIGASIGEHRWAPLQWSAPPR
jgi:predicted MFS family arabinose efflux permease